MNEPINLNDAYLKKISNSRIETYSEIKRIVQLDPISDESIGAINKFSKPYFNELGAVARHKQELADAMNENTRIFNNQLHILIAIGLFRKDTKWLERYSTPDQLKK